MISSFKSSVSYYQQNCSLHIIKNISKNLGLAGVLDGKESACNAVDIYLILG